MQYVFKGVPGGRGSARSPVVGERAGLRVQVERGLHRRPLLWLLLGRSGGRGEDGGQRECEHGGGRRGVAADGP